MSQLINLQETASLSPQLDNLVKENSEAIVSKADESLKKKPKNQEDDVNENLVKFKTDEPLKSIDDLD